MSPWSPPLSPLSSLLLSSLSSSLSWKMQGKHCFLSVVVTLVVAVVVVAVAVVASDWELGTAVAEGVLIKCVVEIKKIGVKGSYLCVIAISVTLSTRWINKIMRNSFEA